MAKIQYKNVETPYIVSHLVENETSHLTSLNSTYIQWITVPHVETSCISAYDQFYKPEYTIKFLKKEKAYTKIWDQFHNCHDTATDDYSRILDFQYATNTL